MNTMSFLLVFLSVTFLIWLNVLAGIAVGRDSSLDSFQRKAQWLIVWLIPVFGAALVLHLVNQHDPDAIPRKAIPWPLRGLVFGKPRRAHRHRDGKEENGIDLALSGRIGERHQGGTGMDGGGSGD